MEITACSLMAIVAISTVIIAFVLVIKPRIAMLIIATTITTIVWTVVDDDAFAVVACNKSKSPVIETIAFVCPCGCGQH